MKFDNGLKKPPFRQQDWSEYINELREAVDAKSTIDTTYVGRGFSAGMLTGNAIKEAVAKGDIYISDFDESRLNANSYNLRLSDTFKKYSSPNQNNGYIDISKGCETQEIVTFNGTDVIRPTKLYLRPGDFVLASTIETVASDKYIPIITGRSSIGRYSISVHQEAGFGDIGFKGAWTLQLSTLLPVIITPGMEICQVYFITPVGKVDRLYDGKYQNSDGPVESKFYAE